MPELANWKSKQITATSGLHFGEFTSEIYTNKFKLEHRRNEIAKSQIALITDRKQTSIVQVLNCKFWPHLSSLFKFFLRTSRPDAAEGQA